MRSVLPKEVKVVTGRQMPHGISEVHHTIFGYGKLIFSFDGEDMFDSDVDMYKKCHTDALQFYGWAPIFNGKGYTTESISRTARVKRGYWPRKRHLKEVAKLLRKPI